MKRQPIVKVPCKSPTRTSGHEALYQFAMHIRETEVAAFRPVGEMGMLDSEQVEHRRVQVMDAHRIADNIVAEIVGLAIDQPGFDPPAGQPDRETAGMMIAAEVAFADIALAVSRAAKFTAPNHESFVQ